ncbi:hypothetical protein EV646_1167 [Kribbella antiqua]|uniref:Uncharacterized protein n=1 Tax=Kribbella antiqua TaxID=2512217 RepID=A0A4R2IA47_9ACTN|nr:hypothetical protein EV646_1167 [Kribbella antiqua]
MDRPRRVCCAAPSRGPGPPDAGRRFPERSLHLLAAAFRKAQQPAPGQPAGHEPAPWRDRARTPGGIEPLPLAGSSRHAHIRARVGPAAPCQGSGSLAPGAPRPGPPRGAHRAGPTAHPLHRTPHSRFAERSLHLLAAGFRKAAQPATGRPRAGPSQHALTGSSRHAHIRAGVGPAAPVPGLGLLAPGVRPAAPGPATPGVLKSSSARRRAECRPECCTAGGGPPGVWWVTPPACGFPACIRAGNPSFDWSAHQMMLVSSLRTRRRTRQAVVACTS